MPADLLSGVLLAALGAYTGWHSIGFGLGVLSEPGAGFFPFIGALLIFLCGVGIAVKGLRQAPAMRAVGEAAKLSFGGWKLWACIAALIVYTILLPVLGFAPSTFLILLGLGRLDRESTWAGAVMIALAGSAGFWLVFARGLAVNFPPSMVGL